jgi:hypothetical protein
VLKDNDVLNVIFNKEDFSPDENDRFKTLLRENITFYEEFREAIINHEAIIAGGSILSLFSNYKVNDIDIYVHYSKAKSFLNFLLKNDTRFNRINTVPMYDESFLRKNNILSRYNMSVLKHSRIDENRIRTEISLYLDIMIVPDHIQLENVVSNFDLSFCKVWWNGKKLSTDENVYDIRSNNGYLTKDYIISFLNANSFTLNRIKKYKERGFNINIDLSSIQDFSISKDRRKSIILCKEEWSVKQIITQLSFHFINRHGRYRANIFSREWIYIFFELYPQKLDRNSIEELYFDYNFNISFLSVALN